ncbi:molybdenum cofactor biosynthesis protein MoaE [soil metagenome]
MADGVEAVIAVGVSETPLDITSAIAGASGPDIGGVGVFVGTVRDSSSVETNTDKPVVALDYDSHPSLAEQRLHEIATEATTNWDVRKVVAIHRTGHCELGEPTVVVVCGAPHRGDALEACRWIIDTIKSTVPIWKREAYADGSSWVGDNA